MGKLTNKTAIITGISSGIGKATALLFAREGAQIIGADLNFEKALEVIKEIESEGRGGYLLKLMYHNQIMSIN